MRNCAHGQNSYCLTCSDEALPVKVLRVDQATGIALVAVSDQLEEIDITLVEQVVAGDVLLVHGGVAMAHVDEGAAEEEYMP